jgi:hypothetical protein
MIAAQYGLPTSSSQCITGGIIGIALCEGKKGLNIKFLMQTFMSWIFTVVLVAMITGFFFAQGAFAPSAQMARQLGYYEEALSVRSNLILTNYQTMIKASGYQTDGKNSDQFATYLQTTIGNTAPGQYYSYAQAPAGFYPGNKAPVIQSVAPWQMVGYLDTALALMQMSVVPDTKAGINMCGNNGLTGTAAFVTNFNTSSTIAIAKFPWSQKGVAAGGNYALSGSFGPCTQNVTSAPKAVVLTKATFLGPSPFGGSRGAEWEDKYGNLTGAFIGTVDRLFSFPSGVAHVTLDQAKNTKICQQAPCNQAWAATTAFMG